jgi:hypothetical protein
MKNIILTTIIRGLIDSLQTYYLGTIILDYIFKLSHVKQINILSWFLLYYLIYIIFKIIIYALLIIPSRWLILIIGVYFIGIDLNALISPLIEYLKELLGKGYNIFNSIHYFIIRLLDNDRIIWPEDSTLGHYLNNVLAYYDIYFNLELADNVSEGIEDSVNSLTQTSINSEGYSHEPWVNEVYQILNDAELFSGNTNSTLYRN